MASGFVDATKRAKAWLGKEEDALNKKLGPRKGKGKGGSGLKGVGPNLQPGDQPWKSKDAE
jgi:hypothetical protein